MATDPDPDPDWQYESRITRPRWRLILILILTGKLILPRSYFVDFVQPRHWMGSVWQELPLIAFVLLLTVFAALYYDLYCIELDLRLPADSPHFVRSFFRYQTKAPGRLVLVSEGYFQPYFYLVIPLSLLLVFKTQVSYSRWWEARCVLGDQQNELRNAARLVVAWIWPKDKNLAEDIVRLIAALAPACAAFMRHETRPLDANADLLTAKELRYVISCKQPPVALGAMISKRLVAAPIETFERVAIEQNIVAFMSTLAPLIRLSTQPLYLTYTRVAVRMVILFLLGGYCCRRCCCRRCSLSLVISRSYARFRPAVRTLCLYGLDDGSRGSADDHHVRDDREHGDPDREPAARAAGGDPDGMLTLQTVSSHAPTLSLSLSLTHSRYVLVRSFVRSADQHPTTRGGDAREQVGLGRGGRVMVVRIYSHSSYIPCVQMRTNAYKCAIVRPIVPPAWTPPGDGRPRAAKATLLLKPPWTV